MAIGAAPVALVSGGGRGIGAAIAGELGGCGFHVVVNYLRDAAAAERVVAAIASASGSAEAVRADVTVAADVTRLVEGVRERHGRIDVLVANANTAPAPLEPLAELSWETFSGKVVSELGGTYVLTQRTLDSMRERGDGGRIVFVSSTAAHRVGISIAHGVAKAALNAFARHIAAEAGRAGVTVNVVAPGAVDTEAAATALPSGTRSWLAERSVTGRLTRPADVARAVAALADGTFPATTGAVVAVDGGLDLLEVAPILGR